MDIEIADELLTELFSAFESADTQSAAVLQFLKDKGMTTDEQLAPYLEQAGNASSVRWRAARVRINSLLSSAARNAEDTLVRKAEEAAQKAVAADREAEKSPRRRRKEKTEKQEQEQAEKSKEPQAAPSKADSLQAAKSPSEQQEPAQSGAAHSKPEPRNSEPAKPEPDKSEPAKPEQPKSEPSAPGQKIA